MSELFYPLKIKNIIRETADAVTVVLDVPENLKEKFSYLPGQYLTFSKVINGGEVRRAYSFSSSPITDSNPAVTIKKVTGGVFSSYINDVAKEGEEMMVMPPLGKFTVHLDAAAKKHYVLFAGGSGITPVMSIAKSVIDKEPQSAITLVYCNQNDTSIIFDRQIKDMLAMHGDRFRVLHCLDNPPAGWTGGRSGRQSMQDYMEIARQVRRDGFTSEYYICGPSGMMDAVKTGLQTLGIPAERIHTEYFTAPVSSKPKETATPVQSSLTLPGDEPADGQRALIILNGREYDIEIPPGETILEAAKANDVDPPYACQIGVCTTCRARLLEGKVEMDEREGLSDGEIAQGYILTCQSHPTTPRVKLVYE